MKKKRGERDEKARLRRLQEIARLTELTERAEKDMEKKRQIVECAEKLWREGHAPRLAEALKAGHPCPVCGATAHPEPARAAVGAPSDAQLERLRAESRSAKDHYECIRARLQSMECAHGAAEELDNQ